ncbi:hypothetical protein [Nostoc sp. LEGE 06077]|nr:hypothetical protein [Nostoc sp. LEGE 06077]
MTLLYMIGKFLRTECFTKRQRSLSDAYFTKLVAIAPSLLLNYF